MPSPIFLQLVAIGKEQRYLEYKQSTSWSVGEFRAKIIKTILAMSNIRDGGHIIIGMERQGDDTYLPKGMEQGHLASYVSDDVMRAVAEYADPYASITLTLEKNNAWKDYVWIQVEEFREVPVICRKPYGNILGGGKLYTRTYRVPESAEVPSSAEMREILTMAADKELKAFLRRSSAAGIQLPAPTTPTDEQAFAEQLGGVF
jgi:hypothetical protein